MMERWIWEGCCLKCALTKSIAASRKLSHTLVFTQSCTMRGHRSTLRYTPRGGMAALKRFVMAMLGPRKFDAKAWAFASCSFFSGSCSCAWAFCGLAITDQLRVTGADDQRHTEWQQVRNFRWELCESFLSHEQTRGLQGGVHTIIARLLC